MSGATPDPEKWEPTAVNMMTGYPAWRRFVDKQNWVNKARSWMSDQCIDSTGRLLKIGADFDDAVYPVYIARPRGLPEPTWEHGDAMCPWCGKSFEAWEIVREDGDREDIDCPSCEKPITVKCEITVSYETHGRVTP